MTYTNPTTGKTFAAKETNGKFFYWSLRALRWLPCKASEVTK